MKGLCMNRKPVAPAILLVATCFGCVPEERHHAAIEQMLGERRKANSAWVRAQSYPAYSNDDPADFFTDPAVLAEQRRRGATMVKAIAAAIRAGKSEYTLEPGEYRIADNAGWEFSNVTNFTLNGSGARIWFERNDPNDIPMRLLVTRCKEVTFRRLQLDFDPPVFIQGTITRIAEDRRTIDMQIDPAWPKVDVPEGAFTIYTPDGEYVHQVGRGMHHRGAELFDGDKLRIKVWEERGLAPNFDANRLAFFGDDYAAKPGLLIALNYRRAHAVTTTYSERITFEDVDIWQSPGGGFHEEFGIGGNVYRRCRLIRKPGTRRIHCGTADHFHSRAHRDGPQIIECEAGYTSDDIINIYGAWRWLLKQEDEKTVWVASAGGVPIGDTLTFYGRKQLTTIDEAEVEGVEELTDPKELAEARAIPIPNSAIHIVASAPGKVAKGEVFRVTLKTAIRKIEETEVLIDAHGYDAENLLVKDCYFHDSFSRALLLGGTVKATVVNNVWDRMNQGVHIFEESWKYSMGPAPRNVTFSRNTVMNMGAGSDAVTVALVPKGFKLMNTQPSRNIVIRDNLFINSAGITMLFVDGGEIRNNTLVEPRGFERFSRRLDTSSRELFGHKNFFPTGRNSAMSVWSCKNVNVSGNTVYCSGPSDGFAPLDVGQWTENVADSGNRICPFGERIKQFDTSADSSLSPHPNLMWKRTVPFDRYIINIARDPEFKETVLNDSIENVARYVPMQPLQPGKYFWQATGKDGDVQSGEFVVAAPRQTITVPAGSGLADIQAAIASAGPYARIQFKKARYQIHPKDDDVALFCLRDKRHLIIDGGGSEFMIHGVVGIVDALHCKDITFRNFTVDYNAPIRTSLRVTGVDPAGGTITARLLPGHPRPEEHPERFWVQHTGDTAMMVDPEKGGMVPLTDNCTGSVVPWKVLGDGNYSIKLTRSGLARMKHIHPGLVYTLGPRGPAGFEINLCENITLCDIRTLMVPGIGISAAFANDLKVFKVKLTRRKDRYVAVQNGGTNLRSARIGVWMQDCFFECTGDDLNHNNTQIIMPLKQPAPDTVIASTVQAGCMHKPDDLDIKPGDRFLFFNREEGRVIADARIKKVDTPERFKKRMILLQFDRDLPTLSLAGENARLSKEGMRQITQLHAVDRVAGDFVFKDNTFVRGRRIGILTKGGPGLIEGNHMEFLGGSGVDAWNCPWSGFNAQDTLIKNNTIINPDVTARRDDAGGAGIRLMVNCGTRGAGYDGTPVDPLYDNIQIIGNRIVNAPGYGITFEDGRNIVIKDNQIEITDPSVLRLPGAKAIHTARVENLVIEGNRVNYPGH